MEAAMNKSNVLGICFLKLADIFPMLRRPKLERELSEAKTRLDWQKKRMDRVQHRYDALDRQCAALSNDAASLRVRLYAAQQQADACKGALQALGAAAGTAEELKRIYGAVSPFLDAPASPCSMRHRRSQGSASARRSPMRTPAAALNFWTASNCCAI